MTNLKTATSTNWNYKYAVIQLISKYVASLLLFLAPFRRLSSSLEGQYFFTFKTCTINFLFDTSKGQLTRTKMYQLCYLIYTKIKVK